MPVQIIDSDEVLLEVGVQPQHVLRNGGRPKP